jgi:hypothetical protein
LVAISGIGAAKLERFGHDVLALVTGDGDSVDNVAVARSDNGQGEP